MKTSIPDILGRIKSDHAPSRRDFFMLLVIVLVALAAFALGRLSVSEKDPILIKEHAAAIESVAGQSVIAVLPSIPHTSMNTSRGIVVASKTGKKYFYPWCGAVRSIKEENKIWYVSVEAARAAGYGPAANCKGLK